VDVPRDDCAFAPMSVPAVRGSERQADHDTLIELVRARRAWERGTANN